MGLLLRILSIAALLVSIFAVILAAGVYFELQASDAETDANIVIALVVPILVLAVITGVMAVGTHIWGQRLRNRSDE